MATRDSSESITVRIPAARVVLEADLTIPDEARGLVLFAHGSGSSRKSLRNRGVARVLQQAGMATALMDLLTPDEAAIDEATRHLRFNIDLLAERVVAAIDWCASDLRVRSLGLGLFGASTGAAAALQAAARRPEFVRAVVSRGGRPDLADLWLDRVLAPTLLIVGGNDDAVMALNRESLDRLDSAPARLEVVPEATHLFEEPGAMEQVAALAADWFAEHIAIRPYAPPPAPGWIPPRRSGPHRGGPPPSRR